MEPQVNVETDGGDKAPPHESVGWSSSYNGSGAAELDVDSGHQQAPGREPRKKKRIRISNAELLADAGIEPVATTSEAAEYFDRTTQWIYWGLTPDPKTGEVRFVWPDGSPVIPERVNGERRFTMPILRAIAKSCYHRGNLTDTELKTVLRRIKLTELGEEWREREGWVYADLGRNRHRWVRPDRAYYDRKTKTWRIAKEDAQKEAR